MIPHANRDSGEEAANQDLKMQKALIAFTTLFVLNYLVSHKHAYYDGPVRLSAQRIQSSEHLPARCESLMVLHLILIQRVHLHLSLPQLPRFVLSTLVHLPTVICLSLAQA